GDRPTRFGPGAVGVVSVTQVPLDPGIHQHVCRPGIKAAYAAVRIQYGDIRDAAQVQHNPGVAGARLGRMKCRHQRRTLATRGNVAATEVGDHIDTGELGDACRCVQLNRVAQVWTVADRLSVYPYGRDVACLYLCAL